MQAVGETLYSRAPNPSVICVSGADRLDFLHRLTSQSFKTRKPDEFFYGACLLANGGVIGLFGAWVRAEDVLLLPLGKSVEPILKFLDQFHFGENVRFELSEENHLIHLFGDTSGTSFAVSSQRFPGPLQSIPGNELIKNELLVVPANQSFVLSPARELSSSECAAYFALHGLPEAGVDLTAENILIEAPLDNFVHRTKGCYPGQEVIERIYTYGNVSKYVLEFQLDTERNASLKADPNLLKRAGSALFAGETKVGMIRSVREALNGSVFAIAQVQRIPAEKQKVFTDEAGLTWTLPEGSLRRVGHRQTQKSL